MKFKRLKNNKWSLHINWGLGVVLGVCVGSIYAFFKGMGLIFFLSQENFIFNFNSLKFGKQETEIRKLHSINMKC